jgi:hypothetical protein
MAAWERDVLKQLRAHDCLFVRHGKGDHDIWYSPMGKRHVTVDHVIKSRHTANGIINKPVFRIASDRFGIVIER